MHCEALKKCNPGVGTRELTRAGSEAMVGHAVCAGTEVDVDEDMNEDFSMGPSGAMEITPGVRLGSSPTLRPAVQLYKV
jgi:hypothetical protein